MKGDWEIESYNSGRWEIEETIQEPESELLVELRDWYDIRPKNMVEMRRIVVKLDSLNETVERVRDFLLSRESKPPLNFFLDDFLDWRQRNPANQTPLTNEDYKKYIESDEWERRRNLHVKQADYRCQLCNAEKDLHVHHRTYERLGCERYTDLIALCKACHGIFHGKLKAPIGKAQTVVVKEYISDPAKPLIDEHGIRQGESICADELAIVCKECGWEYVHPVEVIIAPFEGDMNLGPRKQCVINKHGIRIEPLEAKPSCRGVRITLRFHCEEGHNFEHSFQFRKGLTNLEYAKLDDDLFNANDTLWRD